MSRHPLSPSTRPQLSSPPRAAELGIAAAALLLAGAVVYLACRDVVGDVNFQGGDGKVFQSYGNTNVAFAAPFEISFISPTIQTGSQPFPINVWANPAWAVFWFFDQATALNVSGVVGYLTMAAAVFFMVRSFGGTLATAALAAQACALTFAPFWNPLGFNSQYASVPPTATVAAIYVAAIGLVQRIDRLEWNSVGRWGVALFAVFWLGSYVDPGVSMICGIVYAPVFALVAHASGDRRVFAARAIALAIAAALFVASGMFGFLLGLGAYSFRSYFANEFTRPQTPAMVSVLFMFPGNSVWLYTAMGWGWALGLVFARGPERLLAGLAATSMAVVAVGGAVYALVEYYWWLPLPLYFEFMSVPLHVAGAVIGWMAVLRAALDPRRADAIYARVFLLALPFAAAAVLARAHGYISPRIWVTGYWLQVAALAPFGAMLAVGAAGAAHVAARALGFRAGPACADRRIPAPSPWRREFALGLLACAAGAGLLRTYDLRVTAPMDGHIERWNVQTAYVERVKSAVGLGENRTFRGSVLYQDYGYFQSYSQSDLWRNLVPTTISAYNQANTALAHYFIRRVMLPNGVAPRAEHIAALQMMGAAFFYAVQPVEALAAHFDGRYDNIHHHENAPHYLYRLPHPNTGNYTPTETIVVPRAPDVVAAFATGQLDFRQQVILEEPLPIALSPSPGLSMSMERGHIRLTGESAAPSLAVLPIEYSRCLRLENGGDAKLIRANLMFVAVLFQGKVDARLRSEFGVIESACRRQDIRDVRAMGIERDPSYAARPEVIFATARAFRENWRREARILLNSTLYCPPGCSIP
jgi:hypothetical protein